MTKRTDPASAAPQPAEPLPEAAPLPEPTPAAGGRYRRNPDGTLTPIPDTQE